MKIIRHNIYIILTYQYLYMSVCIDGACSVQNIRHSNSRRGIPRLYELTCMDIYVLVIDSYI